MTVCVVIYSPLCSCGTSCSFLFHFWLSLSPLSLSWWAWRAVCQWSSALRFTGLFCRLSFCSNFCYFLTLGFVCSFLVPWRVKVGGLFVVVQSRTCVWLFVMPWTAEHQASLFFTISRSLLKLMSIESEMPPNHLIFCHPSVFPSIRVFSSELALCIKWSKYRSFGFSVSPSNEYSGLISFRIDSFDLLAVQGTLKSLLQSHSSERSISWVLSLLYGPANIRAWLLEKLALPVRTFAGTVTALLFYTLSGFVTAFLPKSRHLNFMAAVTVCSDFGAQENLSLFPLFPHLFAMKWRDRMPWYSFFECWVLSSWNSLFLDVNIYLYELLPRTAFGISPVFFDLWCFHFHLFQDS